MSLKRSPMKRRQVKKDWSDAQIKRGPCRVCGRAGAELAHTVSQKAQDEKRVGPRGGKYLWVNPKSVIPLCGDLAVSGAGNIMLFPGHHKQYDQRQLSILGLLTFSELMNAARACRRNGLNLRRRLSGGSN